MILLLNDGQRLIMGANVGRNSNVPITIKSDSNSHGSLCFYNGTWTPDK